MKGSVSYIWPMLDHKCSGGESCRSPSRTLRNPAPPPLCKETSSPRRQLPDPSPVSKTEIASLATAVVTTRAQLRALPRTNARWSRSSGFVLDVSGSAPAPVLEHSKMGRGGRRGLRGHGYSGPWVGKCFASLNTVMP